MSAEGLPRELPGGQAEPRAWTVASISRDGTRMLLVDADGNEMSVAIAPDALPRRSEKTTVNHTNSGSTPSLRPRDIQARIRAGESPESVAEAAGTTLERIMPFAAPVMAEREHMADRAQRATVRRQATESAARTLGDAVAVQLATTDSVSDAVEWDSWRRTDGRWALVALYTTSARSGAAELTFDPPGNYVSLDNDDARWLVGDLLAAEEPEPTRDDLTVARERREARPADLPPEPAEPADVIVPEAPKPTWTPPAQPAGPPTAETAPETAPEPEAPRRPKRRGRSSIPSWDEIMFGGGNAADPGDGDDSGSA